MQHQQSVLSFHCRKLLFLWIPLSLGNDDLHESNNHERRILQLGKNVYLVRAHAESDCKALHFAAQVMTCTWDLHLAATQPRWSCVWLMQKGLCSQRLHLCASLAWGAQWCAHSILDLKDKNGYVRKETSVWCTTRCMFHWNAHGSNGGLPSRGSWINQWESIFVAALSLQAGPLTGHACSESCWVMNKVLDTGWSGSFTVF